MDAGTVTMARLLKGQLKIWRLLSVVHLAAVFLPPPHSLQCVVL